MLRQKAYHGLSHRPDNPGQCDHNKPYTRPVGGSEFKKKAIGHGSTYWVMLFENRGIKGAISQEIQVTTRS